MAGINKTTKAGADDRVDFALDLISKGKRDGEIKKAMIETYGIKWRQANIYISRARRELIARRNRTREEMQAYAMSFFEEIIADETKPAKIRLFARKRLDELLGLEEPKKQEITGNLEPVVKIYEGIDQDLV